MNNRESSTKRYVFAPIVDWWVILITIIATLCMVTGLLAVMWSPIGGWEKIFAVVVIMLMVLYLIDLTFFTKYVLTDEGLLIHNQIKWINIPYRKMYKIQHGGFWDLFSRAGLKRFALSSDNLIIYIKEGLWRRISVSPAHSEVFLKILMEKMEKDRKHRMSTR